MSREIDPKLLHDMEAHARNIARLLDDRLNPTRPPRTHGFALLIFAFEGPELTWISNAERDDMVKALKELLERFEAGSADELSRPKGRG
jgi:hypothetical protein